jgi:P27 family predicted phage terminase small subunit
VITGRPPKPTHLKIVGGNPGKSRINTDEPKPIAMIPEPPPELSAEALEEWQKIAPQLLQAGILTVIDRAALATYCQAYGRWVQAERVLKAMAARDERGFAGLIMTAGNGTTIPNPMVLVANKAMGDVMRFAAEFGMTPSGRSRVTKISSDQFVDPAEQYFRS